MIKLISVAFNINNDDEKKLHKAILESGLNFAGTTKELWAKHLNMSYTQKSAGRPKGVKSE